MLNLQQFEKTINTIKEYFDSNYKLGEILGTDIVCYGHDLASVLLMALEDIFHDKETQWISYYMYETDFGTSDMEITEADGTPIQLKTSEDLYNLLTKE